MITERDYIRQFFMEKLAGTLSQTDELHLQNLLGANQANQAIWDELEQQSKSIRAENFIGALDPKADLDTLKSQLQYTRKRKNNLWRYTAAASVLMALSLVIWFGLQNNTTKNEKIVHKKTKADANLIQLQLENDEFITLDKKSKAQQLNYGEVKLHTSSKGLEAIEGTKNDLHTTLSVPAKQDYQVTLSDGTKVWLNSISKLRFPIHFNGKTREVYLEGEAYLDVAKDPSRPFIVHTKQANIRVLGTKFNVNTYDDHANKTSLVEGAVLLSTSHKTALKLVPGEQGIYDASSGFSKKDFDKENVLSWINGVYYFQNSTIQELSQVINRWFDLTIIIEGPKLENLRLSGILERHQLSAFLKDLETSSNIQYQLSGKKLILK